MAVKVLIFGTDDLYPALKPFYDQAIHQGLIEIVGYARFENDSVKIYSELQGGGLKILYFNTQLFHHKKIFTGI